MPNLFVDIETAPDFTKEEYFDTKRQIDSGQLHRRSENKDLFWKFERGGLTPFDGKVILITYQINDGHVFRLKEWELGEQALLRKFYDLLLDLQRGPGKDWLRIIGHNILGFDLFFLYNRMKHHKISEEKWLYQWIMNKPEVIDFLQMHLPLNNLQTRGLKHDVLALAYDFPLKETLGSGETLHYFQEEFDKIIEYSEKEFIYPQLYEKILKSGLITKEKLSDSIKKYQERNQERLEK